jgi:hypothetical protein
MDGEKGNKYKKLEGDDLSQLWEIKGLEGEENYWEVYQKQDMKQDMRVIKRQRHRGLNVSSSRHLEMRVGNMGL